MPPAHYLEQRRKHYGDIGNDFPSRAQLNGYSAVAGHGEYKLAQERSDKARNAYVVEERASANYVTRLPPVEQQYIDEHTGHYIPKDHLKLKPLARSYADAENAHGQLREKVYRSGPYLYPNQPAQLEHYRGIEEHYGWSDYAEDQYAEHAKYA
ncbi:MAG: hypothetical protein Q9183_007555, partial [Haloplaca sp. 2 TL-2023]